VAEELLEYVHFMQFEGHCLHELSIEFMAYLEIHLLALHLASDNSVAPLELAVMYPHSSQKLEQG
jgi:hypothetical protein